MGLYRSFTSGSGKDDGLYLIVKNIKTSAVCRHQLYADKLQDQRC